MPTYNCGKYISQSIKSILDQSYVNFELLVIDDGSVDDTEEIVKEINDNRIIYEKIEHNGTAAALNRGISLAKGDWIARIDADDLNHPDRLKKQINFIENNPQYNIISSWSVYFNNKGKICFVWKSPVKHEEIIKALNLFNPLNQSGLLIKKELLSGNKFDETFDFFEDFEFMYRVREKARFYNLPEYLVFTRIRDDSKSVVGNSDKIFNLLFSASNEKLIKSKTSKEVKYWNGICGDICLFYGNINAANKYFRKSFQLKNYFKMILITTLGEKVRILIKKNFKLRLKTLFQSNKKLQNYIKNII